MRAPLPALFGLALGLTLSACAGDDSSSDDAAATTTATATEDAGATAMTLDASTTITQPPETVDAGGETYGGPEWDTDTFGTTTDGGAATVASDTDTDTTTRDPGTDTDDAGGET
ncbi:MAG: hypothetical protein JKY37_08265, partial [Nannocystaceae bacterium]|nr:hypothetical protein [Nannocystaceae bacterium]